MPGSTYATVASRGLAGELRALRKQNNLTCQRVADRLGWQASKVSRMETGHQGIRLADAAALLVVYGVVGAERNRLLEMAERANERGWWESFNSGLTPWSKTYIRLESEATHILNAQPLLVPGLLQTPGYTRALMRACGVPDSDREARVAARMGRQAILSRDDPPELVALVDEAALRRALGDRQTMARQLRHLADMAERPAITIQVVPFDIGGHTGLDGAFSIMDFERARSVVHLEHKISGLFLEEPQQVEHFRREADSLTKLALSPAATVDLVTRIAEEHEREGATC